MDYLEHDKKFGNKHRIEIRSDGASDGFEYEFCPVCKKVLSG